MPRYARIHVTGGMFHVISRFHDRNYYLDLEGAREMYLKLLGRASQVHDARIIAYCLMSSHVHLVVQLGNDPIGSLMKRVHSPFGNWVNSKRNGVGSVMSDRPKSVLVHSETYGMELIRYVHNNPVRAGIVSRASENNWSSHRAYLGLDTPPEWLATEAVLGPDTSQHESIRLDLAQYVDDGRHETRRSEFSGEISPALSKRIRRLMRGEFTLSYPVLGPDAFVQNSLKSQVKKHQGQQRVSSEVTVETITESVFKQLNLPPALAASRSKQRDIARGRALVAWIWVERLGRPQVMVAEALNLRGAAVSIMLKKLRQEKLTAEYAALVEFVLNAVAEDSDNSNGSQKNLMVVTDDSNNDERHTDEPCVLVLRRNRRG